MDISKVLNKTRLKGASDKPLYIQIGDLIAEEIRNNILHPGTKLPPERELADMFAVSRTTAINAYGYLERQDLVKTKIGSGTYVTEKILENRTVIGEVPWAQLFASYIQTPVSTILKELVSMPSISDTISLAAGMADPAFYPIETLQDLYNRHWANIDRAAFGHIPTEGYDPLRRSIVKLVKERGIHTKPENTLITSGSQQGLYLLSRALLEPGDYVVMESPTFIGAIQVFQSAGAKILSLPVSDSDSQSLLEDYFVRYRPKLLYLIPTFQNPTGHVMSVGKRKSLLTLAARHRLVIVEDDPYSELYYAEQPPPSLKALDLYDGVVYLSTLSKIMFPGLRTGFLVAPQILINRLTFEKQYIDLHCNNISQILAHIYLENDKLAGHLHDIRQVYKKRRDFMAKALHRYCGEYVEFEVPDGGFYFWCKMKQGGTSIRLLNEAVKNGLYFAPGEAFYTTSTQNKEFRLCFTTHDENVLLEAVKRLAKALFRMNKNKICSETLPYATVPPII